MGDAAKLLAATESIVEALSELDPEERRKVLRAADLFLDDSSVPPVAEARKPVPVPVQRVETAKPTSPKAPKSPSTRCPKKGQLSPLTQAAVDKALAALRANPKGLRSSELSMLIGIPTDNPVWASMRAKLTERKLAIASSHSRGAVWTIAPTSQG